MKNENKFQELRTIEVILHLKSCRIMLIKDWKGEQTFKSDSQGRKQFDKREKGLY